jgi:hypothetical protein
MTTARKPTDIDELPDDKPVTPGMTWAAAVEYAERMGVRLPPSAQLALYVSVSKLWSFREDAARGRYEG